MPELKPKTLNCVAETMLITLYLRAMETQRPDALVKDDKALALVTMLMADEYYRCNFARVSQIRMNEMNKVTIILRSREFDRYTQDFLARKLRGAVVHIGCGLDSRFERVDDGQVEWFDLDLAEVIELRRNIIGDEMERYHLLGCSVFDSTWLDSLSEYQHRPFLFLAEGVSMYFKKALVKSLVLRLRDHFPGAELVFDAFSPFHIWRSNLQIKIARLSARFPRLHWGLWYGQEVEEWGDGIRLLDDWGYLDSPEPRLSYYRWLRRVPIAARAGRIYHFRLGEAEA